MAAHRKHGSGGDTASPFGELPLYASDFRGGEVSSTTTFDDRYLWGNKAITLELKSTLPKNTDLSVEAALKEGKRNPRG